MRMLSIIALMVLSLAALGETSEISVELALDDTDYVVGERVRAVIDVKNVSPDKISVGYSNSEDRLFIETFIANGMVQLEKLSKHSFVARFMINSNEGQKLEVFIGDHFMLYEPRRYLTRAVLIHNGTRYEGQFRAFDIVPGLKVAEALQMFSNVDGLKREFEIRSWNRKKTEHLFLLAHDEGTSTRKWVTSDLGASLRITRPVITILPSGEVIIVHRYDRDHFLRSEFWSLPEALEFEGHEIVQDPEVAGAERVRELYRESGGVKAKVNPWWKFW